MLTAVAIVASERNSNINRSSTSADPLIKWMQGGDFNVSPIPNGFEITPNQPERLGASIASDCARLLLAGRETLSSVEKARTKGVLHPAWSSIQCYYSAFYYLSAMFRILGIANTYFQANELASIRNFLGAQGVDSLPGSGMYEISLNPQGTLLTAKKYSANGSHEALWASSRDYVESLKERLSDYAQFSENEKKEGAEELDNLARSTSGLGQQHNISAVRNAVQYRQMLSCWHPIAKGTKRYHETDRVGQALGDNFAITPISETRPEYEEFNSRCLTICGFVHKLAMEIASQSPANSPTGKYQKYHRTLVRED